MLLLLCSYIVGVSVLYFMLLLAVIFYCRSECAGLHALTVVLFYCRSECALLHAPTPHALLL